MEEHKIVEPWICPHCNRPSVFRIIELGEDMGYFDCRRCDRPFFFSNNHPKGSDFALYIEKYGRESVSEEALKAWESFSKENHVIRS